MTAGLEQVGIARPGAGIAFELTRLAPPDSLVVTDQVIVRIRFFGTNQQYVTIQSADLQGVMRGIAAVCVMIAIGTNQIGKIIFVLTRPSLDASDLTWTDETMLIPAIAVAVKGKAVRMKDHNMTNRVVNIAVKVLPGLRYIVPCIRLVVLIVDFFRRNSHEMIGHIQLRPSKQIEYRTAQRQ